MPQDLNENSRNFFSSLFSEGLTEGIEGDFDAMVTRIIGRQGDAVIAGDQALQGLMLNHALSSPEASESASEISASLAGIKQRAVNEFVRVFPETNLDSLIESARASGYDVRVLQ